MPKHVCYHCDFKNSLAKMFTPADWEADVPDTVTNFVKVSQKCKVSKKRNKRIAGETMANGTNGKSHARKRSDHKENTSGSRKIKKRDHTPAAASDALQSEPHRKKRKRNKSPPKEIEDIDEAIISKKKKELYASVKPKELEEMLFKRTESTNKLKQKEKIKNLLESQTRSIKVNGVSLRERMMQRLKAAQFRYLNEKLYLSESKEAAELFKSDPTSFKVYHDGFRQQVKKWPLNPLDVIIKKISKMPKDTKIADMGCGEATLSKRVPQRVRSFDLVAVTDGVEECDMARTPLNNGEMDVAVYCLALMGTNLKEYLVEANRILKVGGQMKIAEVESRFKDVNHFIKAVESYGFNVTNVNDSKKVFYFFDFKKVRDLGKKVNKLPVITLDPCLYKKR